MTGYEMPIYAYTCPACGTEFEKIRSLKDRDLTVDCDSCGHKEVSRSTASFQTAIGSSGSGSSDFSSGGCGSGGGFT
jgi:putative FmdB family regulatory protein